MNSENLILESSKLLMRVLVTFIVRNHSMYCIVLSLFYGLIEFVIAPLVLDLISEYNFFG